MFGVQRRGGGGSRVAEVARWHRHGQAAGESIWEVRVLLSSTLSDPRLVCSQRLAIPVCLEKQQLRVQTNGANHSSDFLEEQTDVQGQPIQFRDWQPTVSLHTKVRVSPGENRTTWHGPGYKPPLLLVPLPRDSWLIPGCLIALQPVRLFWDRDPILCQCPVLNDQCSQMSRKDIRRPHNDNFWSPLVPSK